MAHGFTTFEAVEAYSKGTQEDIDIMQDKEGHYHAIRPFGTKHWMRQGYRLVAVVRIEFKVMMIGEIVKETGV